MKQQEFVYEKTEYGIRILRCFGNSSSVEIPERIEGEPVTELASYTFARETDQDLKYDGSLSCVCGLELEELYLPKTIQRLGRYVFYNCLKFRKLSCYDSIAYMGAGTFTGCEALSELVIQENGENPSCMREILSDLKQTVQVSVYQKDTCCYELIYPQFHEEAVENTPARIINTKTYGMGIQYRNTFQNDRVVWREYDKVFETGKYNMDTISAVRLCICRLMFPIELETKGEEEYRRFLLEHLKKAAVYVLEQGEQEKLKWMAESFAGSKEELKLMLEAADERKDGALVSMLMDVSHRRFPAGKKKFFL